MAEPITPEHYLQMGREASRAADLYREGKFEEAFAILREGMKEAADLVRQGAPGARDLLAAWQSVNVAHTGVSASNYACWPEELQAQILDDLCRLGDAPPQSP